MIEVRLPQKIIHHFGSHTFEWRAMEESGWYRDGGRVVFRSPPLSALWKEEAMRVLRELREREPMASGASVLGPDGTALCSFMRGEQ